jgi:hypothetical protein
MKRVPFSDLTNCILTSIKVDAANDEVRFFTRGGREFLLFHEQAWDETVIIEEIIGSLDDLIGTPILRAETTYDSDVGPTIEMRIALKGTPDWDDKWDRRVFYQLRTIKGSLLLIWCGDVHSSSRSVTFVEGIPEDAETA